MTTDLQSAAYWQKLCDSIQRRCDMAGTEYLIPLVPANGTRWFTLTNLAAFADTLNLIRGECGVDGLDNITIPSLMTGTWLEDIKQAVRDTNGFRMHSLSQWGHSIDGVQAQAAGGDLYDFAYGSSNEAQEALWANWNAYRTTYGEGTSWSYGTILSASLNGYYGIYDSDWIKNYTLASSLYPSTGRVMVRPSKNFFTLPEFASWTDSHDWTVVPFSGEDGMAEGEWGLYDETTGSAGYHQSNKNYDKMRAATFPGYNLNWNILSPIYYIANNKPVEYNMLFLIDYDFGDEF